MKKFLKKEVLFLFFVFILSLSVIIYLYSENLISKKREESIKKQILEIDKQIEKLKEFDEEKYAERVLSFLDSSTYLSTSTDIEIEGVEIIPKGDRKLVINHEEGYQLEIPSDLILNQSRSPRALNFDSLYLIQKLGFEVPPWQWSVLGIFVSDLNDPEDKKFIEESRLFERIATTVMEEFMPKWSTATITEITIPEEVYIDNQKAYKITTFHKEKDGETHIAPFLNTEFVILKDNKIYEIFLSGLDKELIQMVLETFKFIKK